MADPVVSNIVHSGATLCNAPVGEAIPDETTVAYGAAWGGNWERVGYTKAPLTLAYTSEEIEMEVEEELAPVKRRRIKESLTLETVLAELTAGYIALAGGDQASVTTTPAGASQKAFEETTLGGKGVIGEKIWGIECMHLDSDGNEQPIRAFVHIGTAKINGNLEFSQKSSDYPGIPIQIKALADTAKTAGAKLIQFQRVTAPASS